MEIGIAAIDCGADAVYIAGPDFGARKAAGNSFEDIAELCGYAHKFGARVFVTYNIQIGDDELEELHRQMLLSQEAGADAFIVRDERIFGFEDITVPLHASTQCAIRDAERARHFRDLGSARIVLERELSLSVVREIAEAVDCELEFFVHGALCVCYSGECRLSAWLDGRSADRGECIQACRSLYDLEDASGRVLVRNKALLSLKDYNLLSRLEELALAGVSSFKIEGRLKNISYVRNVVRAYDKAINDLVAKYPGRFCRSSFGVVRSSFEPDLVRTFNRGYTELFLDGKRGKWSSMDAPKSMGEEIGTVQSVRRTGRETEVTLRLRQRGDGFPRLSNGDGFAFTARNGKVIGFRGDRCEQNRIYTRDASDLRPGMSLFRNISVDFEKLMESRAPRRELRAYISLKIHSDFVLEASVRSEDGREFTSTFNADVDCASDGERAAAMLREQLSKRSGDYIFRLEELDVQTKGNRLPLLSASTINSIRRLLASDLDALPCGRIPLAQGRKAAGVVPLAAPYVAGSATREPLMLTKYCIRYELGLCSRHQGAGDPGPLFLRNNGRRLALHFDCARCEMKVTADK
ncbi:MAG: U32 family peptidase [Candidatus Cryptobacteroides sp.]|nr:U32 family peptidase [Rikenellaceae bacterium]MDY5746749.1 U32 family peptidase [Candidatus Cryptobacteroides sp.]